MMRLRYGVMLLVRTGDTVTVFADLEHLPVTNEERDTVVALGAIEDQVSRKCLRGCDLLADLVLRPRGPRQLYAHSGEGIDHQAGRVESDDIRGGFESHDPALGVQSERVGGRAATTGRPVTSPPPYEKGTPRWASPRAITSWIACC